jgi:hypothetical protein
MLLEAQKLLEKPITHLFSDFCKKPLVIIFLHRRFQQLHENKRLILEREWGV